MTTTPPQQSTSPPIPPQPSPPPPNQSPPPFPPSKYRFSAVDDLQPPPALSVTPSTPLSSALTMAHEREYSQLTVISPERRKLLGYLDVTAVDAQLREGTVKDRRDGEEGELIVK